MARQLDMERLKSFASATRWMELSREVESRLDESDLRLNEYGFDPYGVSRVAVSRLLTFLAWFYRDYFQVQVHDIDRVQPGAQLLIGNHAGAIGYDGGMAICAMLLDGRPPRLVRAMAERFLTYIPFMGTLAQRIGALTGTPETARRMLAEGLTVLAYPEGARGTGKGWDHRYKLVEFGSGFVRLALAAQVPIQPFASIGADGGHTGGGAADRAGRQADAGALPALHALDRAGAAALPGGPLLRRAHHAVGQSQRGGLADPAVRGAHPRAHHRPDRPRPRRAAGCLSSPRP
jgi:hypothetical protein